MRQNIIAGSPLVAKHNENSGIKVLDCKANKTILPVFCAAEYTPAKTVCHGARLVIDADGIQQLKEESIRSGYAGNITPIMEA